MLSLDTLKVNFFVFLSMRVRLNCRTFFALEITSKLSSGLRSVYLFVDRSKLTKKTEMIAMSKRVTICGVDTSTLPKLTQKESAELLAKIADGDDAARNYFINCNLRLVLSVSQRYSHKVDNLDDIFQIGCVGLIKAVDNFKTEFGVRFSTYAVPMILGEVRRYLREGSVRVSRGVRDIAYQALQARDKLESESVDEASIDMIADEMKLPVYKVLYCLDAISDPVSLSETVYSDEEDGVSLQDHIADKNAPKTHGRKMLRCSTLYAHWMTKSAIYLSSAISKAKRKRKSRRKSV